MNIRKILEDIKKEKKCSYAYLAEKTGKKNLTNISEMFRKTDIKVSSMIMLLDAMEYDIVIQPKKGLKGETYRLDEIEVKEK